jgi:hypothetical protein
VPEVLFSVLQLLLGICLHLLPDWLLLLPGDMSAGMSNSHLPLNYQQHGIVCRLPECLHFLPQRIELCLMPAGVLPEWGSLRLFLRGQPVRQRHDLPRLSFWVFDLHIWRDLLGLFRNNLPPICSLHPDLPSWLRWSSSLVRLFRDDPHHCCLPILCFSLYQLCPLHWYGLRGL